MRVYWQPLFVLGTIWLSGCGAASEPTVPPSGSSEATHDTEGSHLSPPDTEGSHLSPPACRPGSLSSGQRVTDLQLSTDDVRYPPGGSVTLMLRNASCAVAGFNLCFSELLRIESDGSNCVQSWMPDNSGCPAILHTLPPGESAAFTLQMRGDAPASAYRFVTGIEFIGESVPAPRLVVESDPFTIGN